jgi:Zn-dependent protease
MGDLNINLQRTAIMFVPFVMAVVAHEYAHGRMALKWGDSTARDQGRLTLNPIPHMDLMGTLVFPLLMMIFGGGMLFGWAKPVPINPTRFRKYRPGLFWVAFAGPGMNFILGILSAIAFCAIQAWVPQTFYLFDPLINMTVASVSLNYSLGIFNLLPLPPLDGSRIVSSFLDYNANQKYESIQAYSFWILLALIWSGALSFLLYPIEAMTRLTIGLMAFLFQITGAMG